MVPYTPLLVLCWHPPGRQPIIRGLQEEVRLSLGAYSFEMTQSMYTIRQSEEGVRAPHFGKSTPSNQ